MSALLELTPVPSGLLTSTTVPTVHVASTPCHCKVIFIKFMVFGEVYV